MLRGSKAFKSIIGITMCSVLYWVFEALILTMGVLFLAHFFNILVKLRMMSIYTLMMLNSLFNFFNGTFRVAKGFSFVFAFVVPC